MMVTDVEDSSRVAAQELLARIVHSYTGKLHEMLPRFTTISFMRVVSGIFGLPSVKSDGISPKIKGDPPKKTNAYVADYKEACTTWSRYGILKLFISAFSFCASTINSVLIKEKMTYHLTYAYIYLKYDQHTPVV